MPDWTRLVQFFLCNSTIFFAYKNATREYKMKLIIYTVNDKQQLKISKELDADAIFSDHPKILR